MALLGARGAPRAGAGAPVLGQAGRGLGQLGRARMPAGGGGYVGRKEQGVSRPAGEGSELGRGEEAGSWAARLGHSAAVGQKEKKRMERKREIRPKRKEKDFSIFD